METFAQELEPSGVSVPLFDRLVVVGMSAVFMADACGLNILLEDVLPETSFKGVGLPEYLEPENVVPKSKAEEEAEDEEEGWNVDDDEKISSREECDLEFPKRVAEPELFPYVAPPPPEFVVFFRPYVFCTFEESDNQDIVKSKSKKKARKLNCLKKIRASAERETSV